MPAAAWMTVIVAALIIAITAVGLLRVIFHLRAIRATLRQVTGGVQAVEELTSSVPERLTSVNASLKPVREIGRAHVWNSSHSDRSRMPSSA